MAADGISESRSGEGSEKSTKTSTEYRKTEQETREVSRSGEYEKRIVLAETHETSAKRTETIEFRRDVKPAAPTLVPGDWFVGLPETIRLSLVGVLAETCRDASFFDGDYILGMVDQHLDGCRWEVRFAPHCRLYHAVLTARPAPVSTVGREPPAATTVQFCASLEGSVPGPRWTGHASAAFDHAATLRLEEQVVVAAGCRWPETVLLRPLVPESVRAATPRYDISPEPTEAELDAVRAFRLNSGPSSHGPSSHGPSSHGPSSHAPSSAAPSSASQSSGRQSSKSGSSRSSSSRSGGSSSRSKSSTSSQRCKLTGINPTAPKVCVGTTVRFNASGAGLSAVKWQSNGGTRTSGNGGSFSTKFEKAGAYTVTASCSGTTKTATVTVILVTFAPNLVKTGFTKTLPVNVCNVTNPPIAVKVTATVTPASAVEDVSIVVGGPGRHATIDNLTVDEGEGTIAFSTTGTSMTPSNKPNGDMFFQAKVGGKVCAQAPVIVVVPFSLRPVSAGPDRVAGVNQAASSCSTPTFFNKRPRINYVLLWTYWVIDLDVPVRDQFGDPLDAIDDGSPVFEKGNDGVWRPIMQDVSGGTYSDPVGVWQPRPPPPPNSPNFKPDAPIALAWPNAAKLPMPGSPDPQEIDVMVAGFTMSPGVVDRKVISTPDAPGATTGTIEIDW